MAIRKIGEIIAMHRRLRGLSQAVVARAAGRSQVWVSQVELGKIRPGDVQLRKIERILDVPLREGAAE